MHNTRMARWIASVRVPRRPFVALALVLIASLQAAGHYRVSSWRNDIDTSSGIDVDFGRPDVLIRTRSLSAFFRDLLKVPIARDLFQEDLAFYYEMHPGRLGLNGTIRRIAYEHNLTWTDRLVSSVFDEPADVLLWRGPKGSLDYWAIAMSRGTIATVLQEAATMVASDRQLSRAGEIDVDGASVPVYTLELTDDRRLLLTSYRDRVVVLSDAGMLHGSSESGDARAAVGRLLSADVQQRNVYDTAFPADPNSSRNGDAPVHSVAARLHFASFGYQRFFPGVEALKFEFGGGAWSTSLLMDPAAIPGGALGDRAPWTAVPANAALCAMLPIDWSQGSDILTRVSGQTADLSQELEGPAVVCWYADGRIHTPLIAATLKTPRADLEPLFTTVFDKSIKRGAAAAPLSITRPEAGEALWQRELQVPYAAVDEKTGMPEPGKLTVTLGAKGRYIFFSPDATQVTRALATVAKRYPSMADMLPRDTTTLGVIAPKPLASLARAEALVMLPEPYEPVFRATAERHLLPRLDRLATYPAYRLTLPAQTGSGRRWQQVAWQELAR